MSENKMVGLIKIINASGDHKKIGIDHLVYGNDIYDVVWDILLWGEKNPFEFVAVTESGEPIIHIKDGKEVQNSNLLKDIQKDYVEDPVKKKMYNRYQGYIQEITVRRKLLGLE